ncbi:hypothetical protein [Micromonospora sp. CA-244673]|uniref:hypothetical protein n=1 Tax=Micromonospora sp. CA-244673 TaxID=3239958 RepID=UPI003D90E01E
MPASVAPAEKRSPQLLTVLFWIGVALAPLAALILLVADGNGPLRFGAVLAILAVVLIGLSVALRAESGGRAAGAEELRDEIEQLRRELRGEIVAAAQRGNQALDQAQRTQESVAAMRRRLDAAAAGIAAAAGLTTAAAEEPAGGRARVPATEPYDEGRARTEPGRAQPARDEDEAVRRPQPAARYAADPADDHPGPAADRPQAGVYGADRPQAGVYGADRPQAGAYGADRPQAGVYGADRPQAGVYGAPRAPEPEVRAESRQVGVVHHTETVHVTTRHTIVDGGADPAGTRYGGYAGRWNPAPEERSWSGAEPEERPRAGYRNADDEHIRPGRDERSRSGQAGAGWSGPTGSRDDASWPGTPGGEHPWAGVGRASGDDRGWSAREDDSRGRSAREGDDRGRSAREGDDRGWSALEGEDRGWSAREAGDRGWSGDPADDRSWSAGPGEQRSGPAGDRSWRPGQEGPAGDRSWPPGPGGREEAGWAAAPRDEAVRSGQVGWAGQSDRTGPGAWADRGDRSGYGERSADGWAGTDAGRAPEQPGRAVADDPDGDYWSELRTGNRWAAVRDDEHGREIRVGERRAAVHADGGGTEYRIEDRWASVRGGAGGEVGGGWAEEGRPALPAGGVPVPDEWRPPTQRSGQPEWRQVEPEPARYGYPPRDDVPRAGGAGATDRWR